MHFSHNLTPNHFAASIFMGSPGSKPEHGQHLQQPEKTDHDSVALKNAPFLFECLALCLDGQAAGVAPCEVVCDGLFSGMFSSLIYIYSQGLNILFLIGTFYRLIF